MPGAQVRSASYNAYTALAAGLLAWGAQAIWVIDPVNGNDAGDGSAVSPLKTMGEFNSRFCGNLLQQPTTLQLVGDVIDSPLMLAGTRFASGATLTVQGTRTQLVTGVTISAVAALGGNPLGGSFPWQITTAGINWTLQPAGSQIRFSNSTVSFIVQVIDANNVVVMPSTANGALTIPTTSLTCSVEALSNALPPWSNALAVLPGATTSAGIILTDLSFNSGGLSLAGAGVRFLWCEAKIVGALQWTSTTYLHWLGGRFSESTGAVLRLRSAPDAVTIQSTAIVGATGASPSFILQGGQAAMTGTCFQNSRFSVFDQCFCQVSGGMHIRNASSTPVTLDNFGTIFILNNINGGINGGGGGIGGTNVGVAITVTSGRLMYNASTGKPTITATAGTDVKVGTAAAVSYATIGTGQSSALLNAIPPTVVNLVGTTTAAFGQNL